MKAMILAAGEGARLRPLTLCCPKTMLPVGGKPLLEHHLAWLRSYDITEVAINLHYRPDAIIDYFGSGADFGVNLSYSYEDALLGTAGAVKRLQPFFDDTFLVVYGDLLTNLDLAMLTAFHRSHRGQVTITLYRVKNPSACGLVELDSSGRIARFVEKPPPSEAFTDLANAGVYVLEPEVLEYIPPYTFYDFGHDLFPSILQASGGMYGYPISDYLIDIGTLSNYRRAQQDFARGRHQFPC
jgi:NDP-sugar pyrophosphorylase family protein